jgi:multiple sugar transport system substrate-binding protein
MTLKNPLADPDPQKLGSWRADARMSAERLQQAYTRAIERKMFLKGAARVAAGAALASPLGGALTAPADQPARKKPFAGQTVTVAVGSFMVSGATYAVSAWEKMTGGKINIVEIPISDLYDKLTASLSSRAHVYDVILFAGLWTAEFAEAGWILNLEKYYRRGLEPNWNSVLPAVKREMYVLGQRYTVPMDGDMLMGYYRTDALDNPAYQRRFKSQFGYSLQPPQTWTQYLNIAKFFTGWSWDGSRRPGYGVLACMKPHDITPWYFFDWAAPYCAMPGKPAVTES